MTDELFTTTEAAKKVGCSPDLVKRWCANGDIPAIKKGKTWLIKSSDLDNHPPFRGWGKGMPKKKPTSKCHYH